MNKKLKLIGTWFLQVIMGLEFIIAGQAKFTNADLWSTNFKGWGYPDHVYLVIGGLEVIGGILIFFPKLASRAALLLCVIMIGASITHMIHQEWDRVIVTVVLTAILCAVYFLRKPGKEV